MPELLFIAHIYFPHTSALKRTHLGSHTGPVNGTTAGATGYSMSPNANFSHAIFELRFPASRPPVVMWLGDPVPRWSHRAR